MPARLARWDQHRFAWIEATDRILILGGANPNLQHPIGWVLVDEHCHGAIFIAFGENRYLGGENESSLNIDFTVRDADLFTGGKAIVTRGKLMV